MSKKRWLMVIKKELKACEVDESMARDKEKWKGKI